MSRIVARAAVACIILVGLSGCISIGGGKDSRPGVYRSANLKPYVIGGRRYAPKIDPRYDEKGVASWYSYKPNTRRTATGEWFDPRDLSAAHKTLPLPCIVEVTNLDNGKRIKVLVNDRGPFVDGRIIDLSKAAADKLGFGGKGLARVRVRFVGPAKHAALAPQAQPPAAPEVVMLAAVATSPPA